MELSKSFEDFEPPKKKSTAKKKMAMKENINVLNVPETSRSAEVQRCVEVKEKSTQCKRRKFVDKGVQVGAENSISYAEKIVRSSKTTYRNLISELIPNKTATIQFCFNTGLLPNTKACPTCKQPMKLICDSKVSDGHRWYCRKTSGKDKHEHRISIRNGTFFSKSNLTLEEILQFVYLWIQGTPQIWIQHELGTSCTTDVDWASFCREVCEMAVIHSSEQIGGKDIVVEIDESKFAKRKYNVGHRVQGGWVFGGREKDNKKKVFMEPVENRTAETLIALIRKWIAPGSIIWSDCWKSYNRIPELPEGYKHATVNHSQHFVNPETGTCTNRIESDWRHAKAEFPRFGTRPEFYQSYLSVFMWKRKHFGEDLFLQIIKDIVKLYPGSPSCTEQSSV